MYDNDAVGMTRDEWKQELETIVRDMVHQPEVTIYINIEHRALQEDDIDRNTAHKQHGSIEQHSRAKTQNECSIAEVAQCIAAWITQYYNYRERDIVYIMLNYAAIYYWNMPEVVDILKDNIRSKEIIIKYRVICNIVYDRQQNKIYTASDKVTAYISKQHAMGETRYIVLKCMIRNGGSQSKWIYIYEKTENTTEHTYTLSEIHISETTLTYAKHREKTEHAWLYTRKQLTYTFTTWNLAEIYTMVHIDSSVIKGLHINICSKYMATWIKTQRAIMIVNMSVPTDKVLYIQNVLINGVEHKHMNGIVVQTEDELDIYANPGQVKSLAHMAAKCIPKQELQTQNRMTKSIVSRHRKGVLNIHTLYITNHFLGRFGALFICIKQCERTYIHELMLDYNLPYPYFDNTEMPVDIIHITHYLRYDCFKLKKYKGTLLQCIQHMQYRTHINIKYIYVRVYVKSAVSNTNIERYDVIEELVELTGIAQNDINAMIKKRKTVKITITRDRMMARIEKMKQREKEQAQ